MERCVCCDTGVSLVVHEGELTSLDRGGGGWCDAGGPGAHHRGREADLVWRGSARRRDDVIELTRPPSVRLVVVGGSGSGTGR